MRRYRPFLKSHMLMPTVPPRTRGRHVRQRCNAYGLHYTRGTAPASVISSAASAEVAQSRKAWAAGESSVPSLDDEVEVALDGVGAVQDGLLGGSHAAHGQDLHGVIAVTADREA